MRVIVTGHDGYIGSVLTEQLLDDGHDVIGLDTFYFEGCRFGPTSRTVPVIRRDIRDVRPDDLRGVEAVIHLAALCNDPLGDLNPQLTYDINYEASIRLAKLAKQAGVTRFLYSSSCSMYGAASGGEYVTEEAPLQPLTAYARSKVRTEEELLLLADDRFSPVALRNATVYGVSPKLRLDLVLNNLTAWAHTTGTIRILSDGSPWRPLIHVEDVSRAFAVLLTAPRDLVHGQAFNIGSNAENYQVRDLAAFVEEAMPACTVEYAGTGEPDSRSYRVDFTKLAAALPAWKPRWTARSGVDQLRDAYAEVGLTAEHMQGPAFNRLKQVRELLDHRQLNARLHWERAV